MGDVSRARRELLAMIASGALQPGARLGGERELAVRLRVSRTTLRQALALLEEAGAVRRVQGRGGGTFVSHPMVERDLTTVVGVPALLRDQGFTAGSRVVSAALAPAGDLTAAALELAAGDLVAEIVRIRLADGVPLSLERARLPAALFPGLLELPLGGSLYELLELRYGVRPAHAIERIEAVACGAEESEILDAPQGTPALAITRTAFADDGRPFEYSRDLFRADRTRVLVRIPGAVGTAESARANGRLIDLPAPLVGEVRVDRIQRG